MGVESGYQPRNRQIDPEDTLYWDFDPLTPIGPSEDLFILDQDEGSAYDGKVNGGKPAAHLRHVGQEEDFLPAAISNPD